MKKNKNNFKICIIASVLAIFPIASSFAIEFPTLEIDPQKNLVKTLETKATEAEPDENEIKFQADNIYHNQKEDLIIANGNVEIEKNGVIIKADRISYNKKLDKIVAEGNVVILEQNGTIAFSKYAELTDKMEKGLIFNIKVIMIDKSRLVAKEGRQIDKYTKELSYAAYTPCDVCQGKDPLWAVKSTKITQDEKSQNLYYKNASIELGGVPVFYTPFLSHPSPSVKRRSGFLTPSFGGSSKLGFVVQPRYFWDIDDYSDLTYMPKISSSEGILHELEYKKYFYNADMKIKGSYIKDSEGDTRGHLFSDSTYEINDIWRAKAKIEYTSDDEFMKEFKVDEEDDQPWLVNNLKLEGFDNRDYASIDAYHYKIITDDFSDKNAPKILPLINLEKIGKPGKYGAYTVTNLNFASVLRDTDTANSSYRTTLFNAWVLPYTSDFGEKYKLTASLQSDVFQIDNYVNDNNETFDGTTARFFPQLGLQWSLPLIKSNGSSQHIVEPIVLAVLAQNGGNKSDSIPNEDSRDIELTDTNLFDLDRYRGYDMNETGSRVNYGINWSAYGQKTGRSSIFLGQSYKFKDDKEFPEGSGLDDNLTDYIGRIYAEPNQYFNLNYRFRLDKDDNDLNYSDLTAQIGRPILNTKISYIYLTETDPTDVDYEERHELYTSIGSALTQYWNGSIYYRTDLTENGGTIEYGLAAIYDDECFKFIADVEKDFSNDNEYNGGFSFTFTLEFKTLGAFSAGG